MTTLFKHKLADFTEVPKYTYWDTIYKYGMVCNMDIPYNCRHFLRDTDKVLGLVISDSVEYPIVPEPTKYLLRTTFIKRKT